MRTWSTPCKLLLPRLINCWFGCLVKDQDSYTDLWSVFSNLLRNVLLTRSWVIFCREQFLILFTDRTAEVSKYTVSNIALLLSNCMYIIHKLWLIPRVFHGRRKWAWVQGYTGALLTVHGICMESACQFAVHSSSYHITVNEVTTLGRILAGNFLVGYQDLL